MKRTKQLLGTVSAGALIVMTSAPALAEGTSAGTSIVNEVDVFYDVGGVTQTVVEASDTFTVDRRINVDVEFTGTSSTQVNPGEENVVLAFDVTNLSNDTIDLGLEALLNGGTGADADIDDENFEYYIDVNDDGQLDGGDTLITTDILDDVAEDATIAVLVVTDIGLGATNGETFDVVLTANALEDDGSEIEATTGANTTGIDTVLADGAGTTDSANQGDFSDIGTYVVAGAVVSVSKTSRIISDPVNGTTNPKAIPGATVEYCITVANASGAATATNVNVVDDLPGDVTFVSGSIRLNGDAACTGGTVGADTLYDVNGGTNGGGEIDATLNNLAATETLSLYFNVTID
ncbi:MAG: hypothetical protein AAF707_00930 [Pseudomonadota bacterium]